MSGNKDGDGGWRTFVWNPEKREFLGRTGCSWCKCSRFYLLIRLFVSPDGAGAGVQAPQRKLTVLLVFTVLCLHFLSADTAPVRSSDTQHRDSGFSMEAVCNQRSCAGGRRGKTGGGQNAKFVTKRRPDFPLFTRQPRHKSRAVENEAVNQRSSVPSSDLPFFPSPPLFLRCHDGVISRFFLELAPQVSVPRLCFFVFR